MRLSPERILLIRFSSVGDIILSSLLLRCLRRRFPHSQIDYVVKEEFAELIQHSPYLSRIVTLPRRSTFRDLHQLRQYVCATRYDLIVDIHDSLRSRYLSFGSAPVVRVRKRKIARFLLIHTHRNLYPSMGGSPSVALRYLETVEPLGVTDDGEGLEVTIPPSARERVNALMIASGLRDRTSWIGVCPSAKHGNKMWPAERFAEAALLLTGERHRAVILFGSGHDEELRSTEIESRIRAAAPEAVMLNVTGRLSLLEEAALMDSCALILTNDSGLMHLAAARGRPVIALFGPTVPAFGFFPFRTPHQIVQVDGLDCRPCTHIGRPVCPLGHFKCMTDIPVTRVVNAARQLQGH